MKRRVRGPNENNRPNRGGGGRKGNWPEDGEHVEFDIEGDHFALQVTVRSKSKN